jgi:hypothetical protein
MRDDRGRNDEQRREAAMRRTVTVEVEVDVEVADGARWNNDVAQAFEDWLHTDVLGALDGREVTLHELPLRVDGHSVTRVAAAWPYR